MEQNLQRAFELWIRLTGIDPMQKSFNLRTWEIKQVNDQIKESLELDKSYITTLMMMDSFVTEYLNEKSFTVNQVIRDFDKFLEYLNDSKELYSILNSEEIIEYRESFKAEINSALKHYGVENEKVFKMANESESLGFLRRDSLKSMETLSLHQFLQGEPDNEQPKYFEEVFEFWNVNSLIKVMANSEKSGIALALIREPQGIFSYFAFAIRNGGTISILTDKPSYAHPLEKHMSRKPGRELASRQAKHHFPYDLMDVQVDYRGEAHVQDDERGIVPYQKKFYPMRKIKDLEPETVLWTFMMFSLIEEKFFKQNFKTNLLSYTGEMIKVQDALSGPINQLAVKDYRTLDAPKLTLEDITTDSMSEEWEVNPTRANEWLEKRYEKYVTEEVLNVVDEPSRDLFVTVGETLQIANEINTDEIINPSKKKEFQAKYSLRPMDATTFGTAQEVLADYRWSARYNKAKVINIYARKEYVETKDNIIEWFKRAVEKNKEKLLEAAVKGEFLAINKVYKAYELEFEYVHEVANIVNVMLIKDRQMGDYYKIKIKHRFDGNYNDPMCLVNGSNASIQVGFKPKTAEALALMCGCEVSELPEVLQNWGRITSRRGNSILQRVDPMDWVVEDPWENVDFSTFFYLSKSAYNNLRKEHGLGPNKWWNQKGE